MSELKPCPFCGGESQVVDFGNRFFPECKICRSAIDSLGTKNEAIAMWNRRASPWIAFEDRKPEEGQACVFYWIDSDDLETWKYRKSGMSQNRPSHWMPIPPMEEV